MTPGDPRRSRRRREIDLIHTVLVCVVLVILLQILLLNVAVEAYAGREAPVLVPAVAASGVCFLLALWWISRLRSG